MISIFLLALIAFIDFFALFLVAASLGVSTNLRFDLFRIGQLIADRVERLGYRTDDLNPFAVVCAIVAMFVISVGLLILGASVRTS